MSKKVKIILGIIIAFVVLGGAAAGWWIYKKGKVGASEGTTLLRPIQTTFQNLSIPNEHSHLSDGGMLFDNGRYIENVQLAPPADLRNQNVRAGHIEGFKLLLSGALNGSFGDNVRGAAVLEQWLGGLNSGQDHGAIAIVSLGNGEQLYALGEGGLSGGIVSDAFPLDIPAAGVSYTVYFVQTSQGDFGAAGKVWTSANQEWNALSTNVAGVEDCPDLHDTPQICQGRTVESALPEELGSRNFHRFTLGSYQPAAVTQPAANSITSFTVTPQGGTTSGNAAQNDQTIAVNSGAQLDFSWAGTGTGNCTLKRLSPEPGDLGEGLITGATLGGFVVDQPSYQFQLQCSVHSGVITVNVTRATTTEPTQPTAPPAPTIPGSGDIRYDIYRSADSVNEENNIVWDRPGIDAEIALGQVVRFRISGIANIASVQDAQCKVFEGIDTRSWNSGTVLGSLPEGQTDSGFFEGAWSNNNEPNLLDARIVFSSNLQAGTYQKTLACRNSNSGASRTFKVTVAEATVIEPLPPTAPPVIPDDSQISYRVFSDDAGLDDNLVNSGTGRGASANPNQRVVFSITGITGLDTSAAGYGCRVDGQMATGVAADGSETGLWIGENGVDGWIVFKRSELVDVSDFSKGLTCTNNTSQNVSRIFTVNVAGATTTEPTDPGTGGEPPAQPTTPQFDGDFTVRVGGRTDVVASPNPELAITISFSGSERNATIDFNTRNVNSCSISPTINGVSVANNNNRITINASGWREFPQTFELNCGSSARQSFIIDAIATPITGDNQQQECPAGLENFVFAGDQWHIMTLPYEISGDYGIVELFLNPQNLVNIFPFNPNYAGEGSQAYLPRTSAAARGTGFWIAKSGSGTITEKICKNRVNVDSRNQNVELNPVQLGQSGIYMIANPFDSAISISDIQVSVADSGWKSLPQAISDGWADSVHLPHWPLEWSNDADASADQRGWYDSYYASQDVFPRENATAWQIEHFHAISDGAPTLEPLHGMWILLPYSNQTFEVKINRPGTVQTQG